MTKIEQTSKTRGVACIGIFAAVFLLHCWAQPADAQDSSKKLLVAYAGLISTHTSVWLGEDQGFYKKHGNTPSDPFRIRNRSVYYRALR